MTTLDDVRAAHRPAGRRLGIAVGMPASGELIDGVAEILREAGALPARRLARLRPRPGEVATRPQDAAYFVRRYGHEYTTIVLAPAHCDEAVAEACTAEGCALILTTLPV
ncbi:hypothetical protein [Paractinoplanes brasiliensis]|uniref:Uncharacterized protein n=1 Tax=Paractinoplanes brasiliensis TaxID=52695 RepID=A0A4R6JL41_9ACTN|nr:hypothetical protein [Actinoplanes brasiliensis]TDO36829.1 hypothetical protein C8E87_0412 [Actinoplanes brasiliensis]GID30346.1 hypothetical protein Abr02nite_53290 [Actinoplanes brasiliensis]